MEWYSHNSECESPGEMLCRIADALERIAHVLELAAKEELEEEKENGDE